jgi:tripartite-type tricarboxylate transporter receptor subunit TctC
VPFAAGGAAEVGSRVLAQALSQSLGQPVVVEAKPGADGQLAGAEVMRAVPDGYTLFNGTATGLSYVPAVRKAPYDPVADFTPISTFYIASFFLYVHPSLPVRSMAELVDYLRANPGKVAFATAASTAMMASLELMANTNTQTIQVPYKGEAPAVPDLLTGRVQLMFATPLAGLQHAKDGKLRVLVTTAPQRSPLFPDVPTLREAGLPELSVMSWGAIFGPARVPQEIVERLSREIALALKRPDVLEQIQRTGLSVRGSPPDELAAIVKEQLALWRRAVREGKIAPQD